MAGRGRGRGGNNLSLTHEQLQALGIGRGDNTAPTLAPPPLFPKLERKPLPLTCDAATDYMLIVKDQFIEYLHESPAYVKAKSKTDGVERYSDKYKLALDASQGKTLDYVWANMPTELKPQASHVRVTRKRKLNDATEIAKRLQTLEKKESQAESGEVVEANAEEVAKKNDGDDDDEELEEEHEQDYEIDDGTDYANNYFDNGEDYDEDDDNLDDGPVY
ncbi:DNA-directed RNA polymerase III subunit RPC7-like [Hyposmocoma kahamanoa]|uniref:DNA-directed RNA polymerase III subunit RPC7-like n=1 Tax=Hyposmocoma kahamanoa TaxID=1477025 RepID=UPI000E6D8B62|nr:DNA-directed RNA polymerase III subunit RPC7-like [Hyposmocoma kahamanoa]